MPRCNQEQIDARLAICETCYYLKPMEKHPERKVCTECGCGMGSEITAKFGKLTWAEQSCPLKKPKWGPVEVVTND